MQIMPLRSISRHPSLNDFLTHLEGNNASPQTVNAYRTDLTQFLTFIESTNAIAEGPDQIERQDIDEYLAALARRGCSGVTRARKLAAIRAYFRYLVDAG